MDVFRIIDRVYCFWNIERSYNLCYTRGLFRPVSLNVLNNYIIYLSTIIPSILVFRYLYCTISIYLCTCTIAILYTTIIQCVCYIISIDCAEPDVYLRTAWCPIILVVTFAGIHMCNILPFCWTSLGKGY